MSLEALFKYPIVVIVGAVVAVLATRFWGPRAPRWGFVDVPGGRKVHAHPVPTAGGIGLFLAFHAVCAVVFLYPWEPFAGQTPVTWWFRFLPLSGALLALGMIDDRKGLSPGAKLSGQTLIAVAAYFLDMRVQNILGTPLPLAVDAVVTVLWFLLLMNSFNLIDGVDGLATGIALIAAVGIALSLVFRKEPGDVLLLIGFAGACLGFLRYNYYPAKVFLGDTGSLFLGFTLAALTISTNSKGPALAAIGMPLLAVGVPLFDTLLAVWRRSVRHVLSQHGGESSVMGIDQGDRDHLHHRLLDQGRHHSQVAWMLYGVTAFLAAAGVLASVFHDRMLGILGLTFLVCAYTVVRHLAWIELRESGQAVLKGLTRPVRRNRTLILYLVTDLAILNAAMLVSHWLLVQHGGGQDAGLKAYWLASAPIDVVLPFLGLLIVRAYTRVWYLARISEYISAGLAVMAGYGVAFFLHEALSRQGEPLATMLLRYLLMAGIAAPLVVGVRAALRVVQDIFHWRFRGGFGAKGSVPRALVCGAGYRTTLFLREMSFRHPGQKQVDIIGLVSSDAAIRGHYVHGVKVLGSLEETASLVAREGIDCVYLVDEMDEVEERTLVANLSGLGIRLIRWRVEEAEVDRGRNQDEPGLTIDR
ncbi:MAG TPA: hypothetical protein PKE55_02135 [Kiritimatiellia bacterium]|nr:hypothetical protein [Kiritimatiellia bacterium]